jgi:hypothetical protein
VQREAAARQRLERRAVAPVERQKAAGLAGCRAGDRSALDHHNIDAAARQEIGDRRADDAAATDQYPHDCPPRCVREDNPETPRLELRFAGA